MHPDTKDLIITLTCFLVIGIGLGFSFYYLDHSVAPQPDVDTVKVYFDKLSSMPYEAHPDSTVPVEDVLTVPTDCEDRSQALAYTMVQNDFQNVKILHLMWKDQPYGHQAVLWNDRVFDATSEPPVWNMSLPEYVKMFGFNGYTYSSYNYQGKNN